MRGGKGIRRTQPGGWRFKRERPDWQHSIRPSDSEQYDSTAQDTTYDAAEIAYDGRAIYAP